jgi:hypothetical protein
MFIIGLYLVSPFFYENLHHNSKLNKKYMFSAETVVNPGFHGLQNNLAASAVSAPEHTKNTSLVLLLVDT